MKAYRNRKNWILAGCTALLLAGCGKPEVVETVSEPQISVAEEIEIEGGDVIIPTEAYEYFSMEYNVPAGFLPVEGNTGDRASYYSETPEDYSYITYQKTEYDPENDLRSVTEDSFREELIADLGESSSVESYEAGEGDGYYYVVVKYRYRQGTTDYLGTAYLYETSKYRFSIAFCEDMLFSWEDIFAACAADIRLINSVNAGQE